MLANRRTFLKTTGAAAACSLLPDWTFAQAPGQVNIAQISYFGGNWQPRTSALRRLAWEVHKRTSIDMALEPLESRPDTSMLSRCPLAYMSGDRAFTDWSDEAVQALARFIRLGGTLIIDPAYTPNGDADGFEKSVKKLIAKALPHSKQIPISAGHVILHSFYKIDRPVGRVLGPDSLTGYENAGRTAVIQTKHDLGGAWAKDNLGNWEFDIIPGGERQRENAFRLGINLVMWALCLDYKNEEPHQRFSNKVLEG